MKGLVKCLVLVGVFSFSYFAYTKVERQRSSELRDELDVAIAANEQHHAKIAAFTKQKQQLHETLSLIFPDREKQIGEILGFAPEPEAETAETASASEK